MGEDQVDSSQEGGISAISPRPYLTAQQVPGHRERPMLLLNQPVGEALDLGVEGGQIIGF